MSFLLFPTEFEQPAGVGATNLEVTESSPMLASCPSTTGSRLFSLSRTVRRLLAHRRHGVEQFGAHAHAAGLIDEPRCHLGAKRICAEMENIVGYPDIVAMQNRDQDGIQ